MSAFNQARARAQQAADYDEYDEIAVGWDVGLWLDQIWSLRKEARDCGHISISEHFNKWDELGLEVDGRLRESMLLVEALNGSGAVDFTAATVQVE